MEKNDYVDSAISALEFAAEVMVDAYFLLEAEKVVLSTHKPSEDEK